MAILERNILVGAGDTIIINKGDIWTEKFPSSIIESNGAATITVNGSIIGGFNGVTSYVPVSISNYTGAMSYLNVSTGGTISNLNTSGYSIYFSSAGVLKNDGYIGEVFILGKETSAATLENNGAIHSDERWGVGTNTEGSTVIKNFGEISGKWGVVVLSRQLGSESSVIKNKGEISGSEVGIKVSFDIGGQADVRIVNSGLISGGTYSFLGEPSTNDVIRNVGKMIGDVDMGGGNDTYSAHGSLGKVAGKIIGGSENDTIIGGSARDHILGGNGRDLLSGGNGNDTIYGGKGRDVICGGNGTDLMTGGSGGDRFIFDAIENSRVGIGRDIITDFSSLDSIDLRGLDSDSRTLAVEDFVFVGDHVFTATGQLRYYDGILSSDVDGDLIADFEISVVGMISEVQLIL